MLTLYAAFVRDLFFRNICVCVCVLTSEQFYRLLEGKSEVLFCFFPIEYTFLFFFHFISLEIISVAAFKTGLMHILKKKSTNVNSNINISILRE